MDRFIARLSMPAGVLAALTSLVATWAIIFYAQIEPIQGPIQKIMYVHVPSAFSAYAAFTVVAIAGGFYLWQGKKMWDRVAVCSAELGVVFCTIVLLTGPIWGKPIWGAWWVWDARLTSTLILWLMYVAYFVLRRMVPGDQGARFASILGIIGLLDIPFINIAAEKFRTLHPPNVMKGGMPEGMGVTLTISIFAMLIFYVYLLAKRVGVERVQDEVLALRDQSEME